MTAESNFRFRCYRTPLSLADLPRLGPRGALHGLVLLLLLACRLLPLRFGGRVSVSAGSGSAPICAAQIRFRQAAPFRPGWSAVLPAPRATPACAA